MDWMKKIFKKEKPEVKGPDPALFCSVCGQSQIRTKDIITCPGDQHLCLSCVEKLDSPSGAGFTFAIEGPCSFCKRQGIDRPAVKRTRNGLICKDCIRLVHQLAYEKKFLGSEEFMRRRKLWVQGICFFCGIDKATVKGNGFTLVCQTCLTSMASLGVNEVISAEVRCDLCGESLKNKLGQQGIQGGFICQACLGKFKTVSGLP